MKTQLLFCLLYLIALTACENTKPEVSAMPKVSEADKKRSDDSLMASVNHIFIVLDVEKLQDFDKYLADEGKFNSLEGTKSVVIFFRDAWKDVKEGKASGIDSTIQLANKLEALLPPTQVKYLPKIRKEYIKQLSQTLWEADGEASCNGTGNCIFYLKHPSYIHNANIKKDYITFGPWLRKLRFKKAYFYWSDYEAKQYYNTDCQQDNAPY